MLTETGQVFSVEKESVLVQVVQQSTCGSCSAQKGCGQGVLAKYLSGSHFVRIALRERSSSEFAVGDAVELGINEFAMLKAAFLVYLVPLVMLFIGAYLGSRLGLSGGAAISELCSIIGGVLGLVGGAIYVRFESCKRADDPNYAPTIVDDRAVIRIV